MKYLATSQLKTAGITLSTILLTAAPLLAQEAAATKEKTSALQQYLLQGGPLTIFIVAFGLISLIGLSVYNFINLSKAKYCPDDLKGALLDHMINCRVRSAIELSASHPSYLGRMMAYSLPNVDATRPEDLGREGVEDSMADFSISEGRKNMVWINMISLVAQVAPMLGLFGTVFGMIGAFSKLGDGDTDPSALAGEISVALLTTMWGLIVAILAVFAYFYFKGRYQYLVAECNQTAEELLNASVQTVNGDAQLAKIPEGLAV
ncbi:MAG: MotA/TolQ/ExbB proton channel family protein [Rubritalea sp.]